MAITFSRPEPNIYVSTWSGVLTIDELSSAQEEGREAARSYGDERYVLITDVTDVKRFPMDISAFRKLIATNPEVVATLVVNPPVPMQMMTDLLKKFQITMKVEAFKSLDAALERARALLVEEA